MRRTIKALPVLTAMLAGVSGAAQAPPAEPATGELQITPQTVKIGTFYSGEPVRVEGEAEAGTDILLVVRGPDKKESFNKKVRAGPIWISSGKIHISGVPALFLSFSPAPARALLEDETVERYQLDLEAIKTQMIMDASGDEFDPVVISDNYVTMKTGAGIYEVIERKAEREPGRFSIDFDWPRTAPPAEYEVAAYECRDKHLVRQSSATLTVTEVGVPAEIYDFANNRAALYGLFAVLFAVCAGFGIDFLAARLLGERSRAGGH